MDPDIHMSRYAMSNEGRWKVLPRYLIINPGDGTKADYVDDAILMNKINAIFIAIGDDEMLMRRLRFSITGFFQRQYIIHIPKGDTAEERAASKERTMRIAEMAYDTSFVPESYQFNLVLPSAVI